MQHTLPQSSQKYFFLTSQDFVQKLFCNCVVNFNKKILPVQLRIIFFCSWHYCNASSTCPISVIFRSLWITCGMQRSFFFSDWNVYNKLHQHHMYAIVLLVAFDPGIYHVHESWIINDIERQNQSKWNSPLSCTFVHWS